MDSEKISIVVPVLNEVDTVETLVQEIHRATQGVGPQVEIILVDDGSTDGSWSKIRALAQSDSSVGGVRFRRNSGKAAALMAGFAQARGDVVITMDADLQDPPEEIPRLLAKLHEGFDLVSGWKQVRHDPWHKVYTSHVFNRLIGRLTGVRLHDHVCGLKCMRGQVAKELRLYGEMHRFVAVLAAAKGYRVTEIPTLHRPRTRGVGKYGFTRFFKGFLDLLTVSVLTRYRWRPQHVIGVAGLLLILVNLLLVMSWPLCCLVSPVIAFLLKVLMALIPGLTLIAVGLAAEMVVAGRPLDDLYTIVERAGWCETTQEG